MFVLEKEVNGKTFKTEFEFDDEHIKLVKDVLKCLKGKTVRVPDPSKKWDPPWEKPKPGDKFEPFYNRLKTWFIPKDYQWENLSPSELGSIWIPILEWLPIVCKKVSFDNNYGFYLISHSNPLLHAFKVFEPLQEAINLTMGGFSEDHVFSDLVAKTENIDGYAGKISIARELKKSDDSFCFILAHEIQHAINKIEVVYPALINWKGFIVNVLTIDGCSLLDDFSETVGLDSVIDLNTRKIELEFLEHYFGDSVRTWYKSYEKFINLIEGGE